MPAAVMENLGQDSPVPPSSPHSQQEWGSKVRKKNRESASRGRKKQTEKADMLHEEFQALEQSNAALVKEINELKKEVQIYTTALEQHEPHCTKLSLLIPTPVVPGAPSSAAPSTSSFNPDPNFFSELLPDSSSVSLTDLFDWMPWDSESGFPQQF